MTHPTRGLRQALGLCLEEFDKIQQESLGVAFVTRKPLQVAHSAIIVALELLHNDLLMEVRSKLKEAPQR